MSSINVSVLTNKNILAGSSRPLTEEQNKYSLVDENADDKNSLGITNVGNETRYLTSTIARSFYFKKYSNQKRSGSDMLFDRLSYSINSFMKSQIQDDWDFFSKILEKKEHNESEEVIIPVRAKEDPFCIEVELDRKISPTELKSIDQRLVYLMHMPWLPLLWPKSRI